MDALARSFAANVAKAADHRRAKWEAIESRYLGQCLWQQRTPDGRGLIEGLEHKATRRILVVEKRYDERLPRPHTSKPWPELVSVNVYAPLDPDGMSWEGLEAALRDYGK